MSEASTGKRRLGQALLIGVAAAAVALIACTFVVDEREQALVLAFGKPQRVAADPGLHWKLPPPFNNVEYFEDRILPLEATQSEVLAEDQRRLVVDAFARWRITDPLKFYQTVRDERGAINRLTPLLNSSIRDVLGDEVFTAVLTGERANLMARIQQQLSAGASNFGIEIVDVRIRRADLPDQNLQATYERMQTERQREAADYRARGKENAQERRAQADRRATETVAEAEREAQIIRGEADANAAEIFANAFGADPEFYAFYRSLLAYQTALDGNNSTIVMSPDSDFFAYLREEGTPSFEPGGLTVPRPGGEETAVESGTAGQQDAGSASSDNGADDDAPNQPDDAGN